MSFDQDTATKRAKKDLAKRLNIAQSDVKTVSVNEKDFPDMSLGASVDGEMSSQMISSGWKINLGAKGKAYEYRADKYQLRLVNFSGANYIIVS